MLDTDFTIPNFLRAIGKGPEDRPEWWRKCWHAPNGGIPIDDLPESVECETWEPTECPFATILGKHNWTPEKDALLLGAGLEYERANGNHNCGWFIFTDPKPGLTLARAIWAALKGTQQ